MYVRRAIIVALALLTFVGCKSVALQPEPIVQVVYRYRVTERKDTLVLRDSVRIVERTKGDTIFLREVRWRTEYRTKIQCDTIRDTIRVQLPPVQVERKLTAKQKAQMEVGRWTILVMLVLALYGVWKILR